MHEVVELLEARLGKWQPEVSGHVEALIHEIIELADSGSLDILRSRAVEQEVLDLIDEDNSR